MLSPYHQQDFVAVLTSFRNEILSQSIKNYLVNLSEVSLPDRLLPSQVILSQLTCFLLDITFYALSLLPVEFFHCLEFLRAPFYLLEEQLSNL